MRVRAIVLALLAAACGEAVQPAHQARCLIDLRFASNEARVDFLRRNAELIANQAASGALIATSAATTPQTALLASGPCDDFRINQQGLELGEGNIRRIEDSTFAIAGPRIAAFIEPPSPWTSDDPNACVVRIIPYEYETAGPLMTMMAMSGLRGAYVHGDSGALYGAYAESCALVGEYVNFALPPQTLIKATYCANSSMRQCGFEGALEVRSAAP